jgi:hypothetical protein
MNVRGAPQPVAYCPEHGPWEADPAPGWGHPASGASSPSASTASLPLPRRPGTLAGTAKQNAGWSIARASDCLVTRDNSTRGPSVPMKVRNRHTSDLDLRARKDHLAHAPTRQRQRHPNYLIVRAGAPSPRRTSYASWPIPIAPPRPAESAPSCVASGFIRLPSLSGASSAMPERSAHWLPANAARRPVTPTRCPQKLPVSNVTRPVSCCA